MAIIVEDAAKGAALVRITTSAQPWSVSFRYESDARVAQIPRERQSCGPHVPDGTAHEEEPARTREVRDDAHDMARGGSAGSAADELHDGRRRAPREPRRGGADLGGVPR